VRGDCQNHDIMAELPVLGWHVTGLVGGLGGGWDSHILSYLPCRALGTFFLGTTFVMLVRCKGVRIRRAQDL
jgi:hypothetical protein